MTILYVVGARPNYVKMAPVLTALRRRLPNWKHVLVDTGQHYDRLMAEVFREQLGLPEPDHLLGVGSASHAVQTARVLERVEPILEAERPGAVVVPGDVNSTLAVALAAAKLHLPVVHLEAGLRSFDRSMPEELNRLLVDQLSDLLLIHSADAQDNLLNEGVDIDRIKFVGNTMIDTLVAMEPRFRSRGAAARLGLPTGGYVLVTLHRPALVDGALLHSVIVELEALAVEMPVVFPMHPRTRERLSSYTPKDNFLLLDPVDYLDFLSLQADAAAVLTDSGGVQEESTYLGIPCFTLRSNTERPVTVSEGTNTLLGLAPDRISELRPALLKSVNRRQHPLPGWDGQAAERTADVIQSFVMSPSTECWTSAAG